MIKVPEKSLPSWKHHFCAAVLLAAAFLFLGFVSLKVFHDFPNSDDEHSYLFQAELFAQGHIAQAMLPAEYPLRDRYMVVHNDRVFSKYPPGTPLLLATGIKLGDAGLANPFMAMLTLFFIYKILLTLVEPWMALGGVLLAATNSYFVGYSASYFSQPLSLTLATATLYFYRRYQLAPGLMPSFFMGLMIGLLILTRQSDAVCMLLMVLPGMLFSVIKKNKREDGYAFCIGPLAGALALMLYVASLTGHAGLSIVPVLRHETYFFHPNVTGFWQNLGLYLWDYVKFLKDDFNINFLRDFLPYMGPMIFLGAVGMTSRFSFKWFCFILTVVVIFFYHFHRVHNLWNEYGARYWYPIFAPLAVLAVLGLQHLRQYLPRRWWVGLLGVCLLCQGFRLSHDLKAYHKRFEFIQAVYQDLHQHCPEKSIVILTNSSHNWHRMPQPFVQFVHFKRNFIPGETRWFVYNQQGADQLKLAYPQRVECQYDVASILSKPTDPQ